MSSQKQTKTVKKTSKERKEYASHSVTPDNKQGSLTQCDVGKTEGIPTNDSEKSSLSKVLEELRRASSLTGKLTKFEEPKTLKNLQALENERLQTRQVKRNVSELQNLTESQEESFNLWHLDLNRSGLRSRLDFVITELLEKLDYIQDPRIQPKFEEMILDFYLTFMGDDSIDISDVMDAGHNMCTDEDDNSDEEARPWGDEKNCNENKTHCEHQYAGHCFFLNNIKKWLQTCNTCTDRHGLAKSRLDLINQTALLKIKQAKVLRKNVQALDGYFWNIMSSLPVFCDSANDNIIHSAGADATFTATCIACTHGEEEQESGIENIKTADNQETLPPAEDLFSCNKGNKSKENEHKRDNDELVGENEEGFNKNFLSVRDASSSHLEGGSSLNDEQEFVKILKEEIESKLRDISEEYKLRENELITLNCPPPVKDFVHNSIPIDWNLLFHKAIQAEEQPTAPASHLQTQTPLLLPQKAKETELKNVSKAKPEVKNVTADEGSDDHEKLSGFLVLNGKDLGGLSDKPPIRPSLKSSRSDNAISSFEDNNMSETFPGESASAVSAPVEEAAKTNRWGKVSPCCDTQNQNKHPSKVVHADPFPSPKEVYSDVNKSCSSITRQQNQLQKLARILLETWKTTSLTVCNFRSKLERKKRSPLTETDDSRHKEMVIFQEVITERLFACLDIIKDQLKPFLSQETEATTLAKGMAILRLKREEHKLGCPEEKECENDGRSNPSLFYTDIRRVMNVVLTGVEVFQGICSKIWDEALSRCSADIEVVLLSIKNWNQNSVAESLGLVSPESCNEAASGSSSPAITTARFDPNSKAEHSDCFNWQEVSSTLKLLDKVKTDFSTFLMTTTIKDLHLLKIDHEIGLEFLTMNFQFSKLAKRNLNTSSSNAGAALKGCRQVSIIKHSVQNFTKLKTQEHDSGKIVNQPELSWSSNAAKGITGGDSSANKRKSIERKRLYCGGKRLLLSSTKLCGENSVGPGLYIAKETPADANLRILSHQLTTNNACHMGPATKMKVSLLRLPETSFQKAISPSSKEWQMDECSLSREDKDMSPWPIVPQPHFLRRNQKRKNPESSLSPRMNFKVPCMLGKSTDKKIAVSCCRSQSSVSKPQNEMQEAAKKANLRLNSLHPARGEGDKRKPKRMLHKRPQYVKSVVQFTDETGQLVDQYGHWIPISQSKQIRCGVFTDMPVPPSLPFYTTDSSSSTLE